MGRALERALSQLQSDLPLSPAVLRGQLRLISYLQPYDPLYFAAGRKSVSISDYQLTLRRVAD